MKLWSLLLVAFLSCYAGLSPYDVSRVSIAKSSFDMGNGLVAKQSIKQDEIIVSVPLATCISSHRCGAIRGLAGQTDFSFDLFGDLRECVSEEEEQKTGRSWDVNLAVALLMATCGENLAESGEFWESYRGAFPTPDTVTLPFFLSDDLLDEFQDEQLKSNAIRQRTRIQSIVSNKNAPAPEGFDNALLWAFAMVRSRCFQVSDDWFAMVPIIDISNHDTFGPSAKFEVIQPPQSQALSEEEAEDALFTNGVCILRATKDLTEGDSITINYGGVDKAAYSNERLLIQYGFTDPGNPTLSDNIFPSMSNEEKAMSLTYKMSEKEEDAVIDAASRLFADGGSLIERVQSVAPLLGRQVKLMPIKVLYDKIKAKLSKFLTTLAEDYELCQQIEEKLTDGVDQTRLLTCVRYRIDVKENLTVAELVLKYALQLLA